MANATFSQTFNSFCGFDMLVTFGNEIIGEIQGLSYTITREKAPLYTMGSANPRSFSRGKRGIAGSLIFLVFDRSAMLDVLGNQDRSRFVGNRYEVRPEQDPEDIAGVAGQPGSTLAPSTVGAPVGGGGIGLNSVGASKVLAKPQYSDQIMPFNITVTAANEYGHVTSMHILGVEIMNTGSGMSVDDITVDESCTFVCTDILPWGNQKFVRDGVEDVSRRSQSPRAGGGII
jgi:hypothetical protein